MKKILIPGIALAVFMLTMDTLKFTHHFPTDTILVFLLTMISGFGSVFLIMTWVKKKYYSGSITFKEAFSSVAYIALFACMLAGVCAFVFFKTNQDTLAAYVQGELPKAKQRLLDMQGSVPANFEEQTKWLYNPALQASAYLVWYIILLLFTLLSAAILKNKKQDGEIVS